MTQNSLRLPHSNFEWACCLHFSIILDPYVDNSYVFQQWFVWNSLTEAFFFFRLPSFLEVFSRDLEKDVAGDTSGHFKKFLISLLQVRGWDKPWTNDLCRTGRVFWDIYKSVCYAGELLINREFWFLCFSWFFRLTETKAKQLIWLKRQRTRRFDHFSPLQ